MHKLFRRLIKIVGRLLALLAVTVAVCLLVGVTVDLAFLRPGVEAAAKP